MVACSSLVRGINLFYLSSNFLMELVHFFSSHMGLKADLILNGKKKKAYRSERIDSITRFKREVRCCTSRSPIVSGLRT